MRRLVLIACLLAGFCSLVLLVVGYTAPQFRYHRVGAPHWIGADCYKGYLTVYVVSGKGPNYDGMLLGLEAYADALTRHGAKAFRVEPAVLAVGPLPVATINYYRIPSFLVLIPCIVIPALLAAIKMHRLDRRKALGLCLTCGYDLKGNESGVCSECGTASRGEATAAP